MFLSPTDDLGENQLFPGQRLVQVCLYPAMLYCLVDKSGNTTYFYCHLVAILPARVTGASAYRCSMDVISETLSPEEAT